jgi:hypothetical protein
MSSPYEGLQEFVNQVPDVLQPLGVALVGMIPYVEGEGSAALGIIAGVDPIVAGFAGAVGNFLSVLVVVLLSSRVRERVVAWRAGGEPDGGTIRTLETETSESTSPPTRRAKGQRRLRGWLSRFGVPGASMLAPLALPTQLTAAFFVASGVSRQRVLLWQAIAIVVWTAAVAAAATGVLGLLGW